MHSYHLWSCRLSAIKCSGLPLLLFSCSVMSNSLQPQALQHARFPYPSLSPRVCSNSCLLSWWCHTTISSSVTRFSCPQSFPASGSFPMSQLFASGGQSIGASALVLLMNIQGWFPLGLTGLISLLSKGLLRVFSNTTVWKHQSFSTQPSLWLPLTQTIMWMVPPGLKAYNSLVSNFSIFLGRSFNLTPRNSWEKCTSA